MAGVTKDSKVERLFVRFNGPMDGVAGRAFNPAEEVGLYGEDWLSAL